MKCRLLTVLSCTVGMMSVVAPHIVWGDESNLSKPEPTEAETEAHHGSIDEVVVTATKIGKKASQMTDAVTVIDEEEIRQSSQTDTTEILRYTPSVQFKRSGGPGQFVYTKLRGYGDGNFVMLIDGMKINESMSAGTGNFLSKFDPFFIERIEVLKGPQSVLYGADTTAGVFSYTTKGGLPGHNISLGAEYGTYDWKKGSIGTRGTVGDFRYSVNAVGVDSGGIIRKEDFYNVSPQIKLGWGTKDSFDVEFSFLNVNSRWNYARLIENSRAVASASDLWAFQIPDPERYNDETYYLATLNLKQRISEHLRQKLMLGWFKKRTKSNNPNNGLLGAITAPDDNFTVDYVNYYNKGQTVPVYDDGDGKPYYYENSNYQGDYNLVWDAGIAGGRNTALLGANWTHQEGRKWGKYGANKGQQDTKGVYFNDQLLLFGDALMLDGGIRYDFNRSFENKATWKVGAMYTLKATATSLFVNYGTSFRQPTITNLYDPKYGNPDVKPEKAWTVQGGVRQRFLDGRLQLEATGWKSELKNAIVYEYITLTTGHYVNRDRQKTQGVECSFFWNLHPSLSLLGNYTYTDSRIISNGISNRTVQIAPHNANIGLEYNWDEKLFLGLNCHYQGQRYRWKGDVKQPSYTRFDLTGRYVIGKGVTVYTRINNMFDRKIHEDPYLQPGINVVGGLNWDFSIGA